MRHLLLLAILLQGLSIARAEPVASFPCTRAKGWVENTICSDDHLARLDIEMAEVHARMLRTPDARKRLRHESEQQGWRANRSQCQRQPDAKECLKTLYQERLAATRSHPEYPGDTPAIAPKLAQPANFGAGLSRWVQDLSRHTRAISACLRASNLESVTVHKAMSVDQGEATAVWLMTERNRYSYCKTDKRGDGTVTLRSLVAGERPPESEFLLWIGPRRPPARCSPVEVLSPEGTAYGWAVPSDCTS